jgi:GxxExxY protein
MKDADIDLKPASSGKHDQITEQIIRVFFEVYNELGFGFLESVYRESMRLALVEAGFKAVTEVPIPVSFRGTIVGVFRADLIVNNLVLIELKASDQLTKQNESQTLHYRRATTIEVALLMNFGPAPHFKRLVLDNSRKKSTKTAVQL